MGVAKFRADVRRDACMNGSIPWYSKWMGGPSLAKIENCPFDNIEGWPPATVHIQGEPDTFFSIPAAVEVRVCGVRMVLKGFVTIKTTGEDSGYSFFVSKCDNEGKV